MSDVPTPNASPQRAQKKNPKKRGRPQKVKQPAAANPAPPPPNPNPEPVAAPSISVNAEEFAKGAAAVPDVIGDVPNSESTPMPPGEILPPASVGWPESLCMAIYAMLFLAMATMYGDFWALSEQEKRDAGPVAKGAADELWPNVENAGVKAFLVMLLGQALPRILKTDWKRKRAAGKQPPASQPADPQAPPSSAASSETETSSASLPFLESVGAENLPKWGGSFH